MRSNLIIVVLLALGLIAAPTHAETVTIRLLEHSGPDWERFVLDQIDRFYAQTGIRVEAEFTGAGNVPERLAVLMAGGAAPDVTFLVPGSFMDVHEYLMDIAPFMERDGVNLHDYPSVAMDELTTREGPHAGAIAGLPISVWTFTGAYNVRHMAEAGLAPPTPSWTWDDLREYVRRLTRHGEDGAITRYGLAMADAWTRVGTLVHYSDGKWVDDYVNPTRSTLHSPETRRALAFAQELFEIGTTRSSGPFRTDDASISYDAGPHTHIRIAQAETDIQFEWVPFAAGPGQNRGVELTTQFHGIVNGTEHPREGWEWIKFMNNTLDSQVGYGEATGRLPAYLPALHVHIESISREHPSIAHVMNEVLQPTSYTRPTVTAAIGVHRVHEEWLRRVLRTQEINLESAIVQADRIADALIAEWRGQQ